MTVVRREPPKTVMDVIEIQGIQNFLEVQAASKYDGTVQITGWLRGTDLSDPRSYTPVNPKEHKGIGARVSQEDLPALIEFLQAQVKPLPPLPTTAGSVVKATRNHGAEQATDVPRDWVLMSSKRWLSLDAWYDAAPDQLRVVEVLFDAGKFND